MLKCIFDERTGNSESGQGMVEYGLILVLVSIVAIGALGGIGSQLNTKFGVISTKLENKEDTTQKPVVPKDPEEKDS